MAERALSFRDLRVYKKAFDLQHRVFVISKAFPKEEKYSLTDQVRRSSRSVGGNIAEAWQKRRYVAHFVSKLSDADGEQAETQHWLATALTCEYLAKTEHDVLLAEYCDLGRMLGRMMQDADSWCAKPVDS